MDIYKRIYELENEIAALPQGSINMKKIYGKEQPYLQWTENGKSKSKYIKKNEREEIFAGVERRKQLQEELKELKQHSSIDPSKSTDFETSVIIGERLLALTKGVKNWGKRDCFSQGCDFCRPEDAGDHTGITRDKVIYHLRTWQPGIFLPLFTLGRASHGSKRS